MDVMLTDVEKILEDSVSPQVENKLQQFQALRDGLNHQRGQVLRQQHLIAEEWTLRKRFPIMVNRVCRVNPKTPSRDMLYWLMRPDEGIVGALTGDGPCNSLAAMALDEFALFRAWEAG